MKLVNLLNLVSAEPSRNNMVNQRVEGSLHIIRQGCSNQHQLSCRSLNRHRISVDPVNLHPLGSEEPKEIKFLGVTLKLVLTVSHSPIESELHYNVSQQKAGRLHGNTICLEG